MKYRRIVLLIFMLLIIPNKVLANEFLTCQLSQSTAHVGDTVTFYITLRNSAEGAVSITSSNTNVATVSDSYLWAEGTKTITISAKTAGETIVKVQSEDTIDWEANEFNESCQIKLTVTEYSTNNYLSNLSISGGQLNPVFNKNTLQYTATVNAESVTIAATKEDNKSTVTGTGAKSLNYGQNTFSVQVKSESGATRTYRIIINRPKQINKDKNTGGTGNTNKETPKGDDDIKQNKSNNNNLKNLTIEGYEIGFSPDNTKYEITVPSNVDQLNTIYETEDEKAVASVEGNSGFQYGSNSIVVTVISESGTAKQYEIVVNKESPKECLLEDLQIENYPIDFKDKKYNYTLKINQEQTLNIIAKALDEKAEVTIEGNENLVDGSKILIKVKAEGQEAIYTINITKDLPTSENVQKTSFKDFIITVIVALTLGITFTIFYLKKNL